MRYVYPDSPAAKAGLKPADRITEWQASPSRIMANSRINLPRSPRATKPSSPSAAAAKRCNWTCSSRRCRKRFLPSFRRRMAEPSGPVDPKLAVGIVPIRFRNAKNKCLAYVPANYNPQVPCGVVIWLHPPGPYKETELLSQWKEICDKHDLILLAPESNDPARWQREELGFIRKTLDEVVAKYHVDRNRMVVGGQEAGGGMAYLLA